MTQKLILLIAFLTFFMIACSPKKVLTDKEKELVADLGLDLALMTELRELTDSAFTKKMSSEYGMENFRDSTNYKSFKKKGLVGIVIEESQENASKVVNKLKDIFSEEGYYIYLSETNYGYSPDKITVLRTDDKFDVLRFEGTNGINYDIYVEDIIHKLKNWDDKYGLEFTGTGFDFFQANYRRLPENIQEHAEELYSFCPDIVDQGVGSISALKQEIERSNELYLWWD
ncbi:DUF4253 domain-containing protein [Fulvivirga sp. M361]|uniref:DUF4253 domain-containing protein n=1 Tax=Fulvivirga sp. M361 TaxID=2594266 RepID=UPI00117A8CBF|nr:DUF4253 domain-containing protein [Fulvivirga sp. M361]TRX60592.1 DUF4253 domain-containing protein [Fulvivirga sp. M361]